MDEHVDDGTHVVGKGRHPRGHGCRHRAGRLMKLKLGA